jgi:DNA-binding winged helix-turn-helix (wHTH) protein/tetratricopeptide (TPR) repeat protein
MSLDLKSNISQINLDTVKPLGSNIYRFENYKLDAEHLMLYRNGDEVSLTPKQVETLLALVERSGEIVSKDELMSRLWGDASVEESNLIQNIYVLRKVFGETSNGKPTIETLRRRGYRFNGRLKETGLTRVGTNGEIPFVPSLAKLSRPHSTAAEVEHLVTDEFVEKPPPTKVGASRRYVLFGVGFLTAVFLLVILSFNFQPGGSRKTNSIAVLPLKPIDSANRYDMYEIGIADSLIYRLGTMKGIIVRPLGAIRKYEDVAQDPLAAGKEQQAEYVLASNYQIADGKIRITAQLFNVESGKIEETYKTEKDAANLFALQDTIAGEIGNLLQARFALTPNTTMARRGTSNEEAYRLYLQGKNLATYGKPGGYKKAIERYEQAIKLDSNFAPAYARLAFAYYAGEISQNTSDNAAKVKELVNKALELDPNLAEAYVSRGFVSGVYDWDPLASEKDYLRAIELEPSNEAAHWLYALNLSNRGRFDDALAEIEIARTIEPAATMHMWHRGQILYSARRYDEAIKQWQQAIDLDDRPQQPYAWLSRVYEIKGDYASAYQLFLKREERSPRRDRLEIYQKVYETEGWIGVKKELAESLGVQYFDLARLYALQGEKDAAFEALNKAIEKREWFIVTLNVEPAFDNLRGDPRFDELLGRTGWK